MTTRSSGRHVLFTALLSVLAAHGCAASGKLGETSGTGGDDKNTASTEGGGGQGAGGGSPTGGGGQAGAGIGGFPGTGGQTGGIADAVYVHDPSTLHRIDPKELTLTTVGVFDCVVAEPSGSADSGMHDIAIDKDGAMYGVAKMGGQSPGSFQDHVIVAIDRTTGKCTKELTIPKNVADPEIPVEVRGLSFVPAGTLDPDQEVLVGLDIYGAYLRIDLPTKTVTLQGSLDGGGPGVWGTKGADIVSIIGDKTYVTAKNLAAGEADDRLAIMAPETGAITQSFVPTGLITIGGLAYWGGTLYAFTTDGGAYSMDPKTGVPTPITILGAPPGIQYHGAGVTTAAPLEIPK